jgi:DNA (cytosine-5)-methyltransferase 1
VTLALDLFCGEGGVSAGLTTAGFDVVGVDLDPRALRRYPFEGFRMDALWVLRALLAGHRLAGRYALADFGLVWASCPCQAHTDLQKQSKIAYVDLIAPTRELLERAGLPYIIENVEGAPLRDPVQICGAGVPGVSVIRHRRFESNLPLVGVDCPRDANGRVDHPLVFTYDKRKAHYGQLDQDTSYVQVTGGGNCTVANKRRAMGTPWMSGHGCNEAIPPAYAEHLGRQAMAQLSIAAAA